MKYKELNKRIKLTVWKREKEYIDNYKYAQLCTERVKKIWVKENLRGMSFDKMGTIIHTQ
jgi:hypothetical protein